MLWLRQFIYLANEIFEQICSALDYDNVGFVKKYNAPSKRVEAPDIQQADNSQEQNPRDISNKADLSQSSLSSDIRYHVSYSFLAFIANKFGIKKMFELLRQLKSEKAKEVLPINEETTIIEKEKQKAWFRSIIEAHNILRNYYKAIVRDKTPVEYFSFFIPELNAKFFICRLGKLPPDHLFLEELVKGYIAQRAIYEEIDPELMKNKPHQITAYEIFEPRIDHLTTYRSPFPFLLEHGGNSYTEQIVDKIGGYETTITSYPYGVIQPDGIVYLRGNRVGDIAHHEIDHALNEIYLPHIPSAVDEGLSTLFQYGTNIEKNYELDDHPYLGIEHIALIFGLSVDEFNKLWNKFILTNFPNEDPKALLEQYFLQVRNRAKG